MKREPSLHITKSELIKVLDRLGIEHPGQLADDILFTAKPHSINSRNFVISNERLEKKVDKITSASRRDADRVAQLIHTERRNLKHRGIKLIKPGGKEWELVKQIAANALVFSLEFDLMPNIGFAKYISIGISKMKKFSLTKFLPMHQGICEAYQAVKEIQEDDDSDLTREMYLIYVRRVIEKTGIHSAIDKIPEQYVWFVRAREQAEDMDISVSIYMSAQFEGFDFSDGIPHPVQLTGPKATERVIRYCYKNGIKVKGK